MARSFLKEKQVPSYFWGEAVRHSVYVLNRLPTRALSNCTPYEAWSGQRPDVSHIRIFGCCAFMKVLSVHTKKLDDLSKYVVYLGWEPGTKANRLYDLVEKRVHVSRDVTFVESKAWAWNEGNAVISAGADNTQLEFTVEGTHTQVTGETNIETTGEIDVDSPIRSPKYLIGMKKSWKKQIGAAHPQSVSDR